MPDAQDPYEVLQVSPSADSAVIELSYKNLARKFRRDAAKSPDAPDAQEGLKRLNRAYDILSNPKKRAAYDRDRAPQESTQPRPSPAPATKQTAQTRRESPSPTPPPEPTPSATPEAMGPSPDLLLVVVVLAILFVAGGAIFSLINN